MENKENVHEMLSRLANKVKVVAGEISARDNAMLKIRKLEWCIETLTDVTIELENILKYRNMDL